MMKQTNEIPEQVDIVIVGAGNAAMCAALSARESGAEVAILERAPIEESGGNSRFTAGAIRCVYDGVDDLRRLMPDLTDQEIADTKSPTPISAPIPKTSSSTTWVGSRNTAATRTWSRP